MKVIHIESGLGNQMLSYCEYLALKQVNPNDDFYLETVTYDIPECNDVICQWNGYELKRIFNIKEPANVCSLFSKEEWNSIINEIRKTEFWNHNWNYPVYITKALNHHGLCLENIRGDFEDGTHYAKTARERKITHWNKFTKTKIGSTIKRYYYLLRKDRYIAKMDKRDILFMKTDRNLFTGQWLMFKMKANEIYRIENEIRSVFRFPPFSDSRNQKFSKYLESCNSVAIHARRGDMLAGIGWMYKHGFFRRAVKYIRRHVENPVFVFFTNTGSIEWCKENGKIFGLDYMKDSVFFVDWN